VDRAWRSVEGAGSTGVSGWLPHSVQLPSYTAVRGAPSTSSASMTAHAVTPLPQLPTMGRAMSTPASAKRSRSRSAGSMVPSAPTSEA
jgi:hypothetical protein